MDWYAEQTDVAEGLRAAPEVFKHTDAPTDKEEKGFTVEAAEGALEGFEDDPAAWVAVGETLEGAFEEGLAEGLVEGFAEGFCDGFADGFVEGLVETFVVGFVDGTLDESGDGFEDGIGGGGGGAVTREPE
jgi:flagellar biosynthesis/type III secretory pathway protein FliH